MSPTIHTTDTRPSHPQKLTTTYQSRREDTCFPFPFSFSVGSQCLTWQFFPPRCAPHSLSISTLPATRRCAQYLWVLRSTWAGFLFFPIQIRGIRLYRAKGLSFRSRQSPRWIRGRSPLFMHENKTNNVLSGLSRLLETRLEFARLQPCLASDS